MQHLRLQSQLILATFAPLIVFALLSSMVAAYALRVIPRDLILRRQTALAQMAAAGVAGNLRAQVRLLESVAEELAGQGDVARQQQILDGRAAVLSTFTGGAVLLDAQGVAVAVTPDAYPSLGLNFAYRPYFQEVKATQAATFSTVFEDDPGGFNVVVIAVPLRRPGAFQGVLLGAWALDRREWARDLNLLRTSEGGRAYVIDSASTVVYHPDAARIGSSIQADAGLWRLAIGGKPQSVIYQPNGASEPMVVSFAPIPGIAWGLMTEEPWRAILAAIVPYQVAAGGLMVAGILLALAALLLSIRRVTGPLNALVSEGQRVATGEPFRPLAIRGPSDLRTLLQVVNQMVARLGEQQAALRRYALQVLRSQEEERLRLSRDLHDQTVQDLVALNQRIELAADALDGDPDAAKARLNEVAQLARGTLAEVRRMSKDLRPFVLEDLGLAASLQVLTRELGSQMPSARVGCEVVGGPVGGPVRLPPEGELTVYRVAQEALTNVRKHAPSATQVNVALFYEDWGVQLRVEDNGPGFEAGDTERLVGEGHLGLAGMRERAQLFGGELSVESELGVGTAVSLRLPAPAPDQPAEAG